MDELVAKLRSQVGRTQESTQDTTSESAQDTVQDTTQDMAQKMPSALSPNSIAVLKDLDFPYEITSSQVEAPKASRFKLDFDALRKYRKPESIRISDVKSSDLLKIEGPLLTIIKSIETYKGATGCVYKWELIDESGVIFASSVASDPSITVGSIISISNFSVWRLGGNHLNIIQRNIKNIFN